jgi:hypothetical protein
MVGGVGSGRELMTDGCWAQINSERQTIACVHIRQYASRARPPFLSANLQRLCDDFCCACDLRGIRSVLREIPGNIGQLSTSANGSAFVTDLCKMERANICLRNSGQDGARYTRRKQCKTPSSLSYLQFAAGGCLRLLPRYLTWADYQRVGQTLD